MTLIGEFTRGCLAIRAARRINSFGVIGAMVGVMLNRGVPEHIRSDNGAEMTAKVTRSWFAKLGGKDTLHRAWQPVGERVLRALQRQATGRVPERFYSLKEAMVVIEHWRNHYSAVRPHSSLNYRPPAPLTSAPKPQDLDRSVAMQ